MGASEEAEQQFASCNLEKYILQFGQMHLPIKQCDEMFITEIISSAIVSNALKVFIWLHTEARGLKKLNFPDSGL